VPRSKTEWSYTSTPQYAFMAWCLFKHGDNFTLLYLYFDYVASDRNLHVLGVTLKESSQSALISFPIICDEGPRNFSQDGRYLGGDSKWVPPTEETLAATSLDQMHKGKTAWKWLLAVKRIVFRGRRVGGPSPLFQHDTMILCRAKCSCKRSTW